MLELKSVLDLARRYLRPDSARLWLRSPDPALGFEKPLDVIGRGGYRQVIGSLLAMAEGLTT